MSTFITLYRYTERGIGSIKDSPSRLDAARRALEEAGGRMHGFWLVMGQYDAVVVWDAPDDESAAQFVITVASNGNVSSETLRAFPESEYRDILARLP